MSSRRSVGSLVSDDEINNMILQLQALLQTSNQRHSRRNPSASNLLKEVCNHIRKLQREVDDLSGKICELLSAMDVNSVDAEILSAILQF
ncbi:hypothetical protein Nepgr_023275 [Nepenthes gracilis]|uniref:Uncharacterized protein n=1 Tax=Nepenthes gracilis TaxID=150966 RepID=A0AAD3XXR3_NEPGR|nr:hypothetical protein Nepgr_023275 [Nepenthes gracilis]